MSNSLKDMLLHAQANQYAVPAFDCVEDQIREAVRHGICKLNIYADCRIAMGRGLRTAARNMPRTDPLPRDIFGPVKKELLRVVGEKMELLSTVGQARHAKETLP